MPAVTLLAKVWGYEYREEDHHLRLYVFYVRRKSSRIQRAAIYP